MTHDPTPSPLDVPGDFRLLLCAASLMGTRTWGNGGLITPADAATLAVRDADAVLLALDVPTPERVGRLLGLLRECLSYIDPYATTRDDNASLLLARIKAELEDHDHDA